MRMSTPYHRICLTIVFGLLSDDAISQDSVAQPTIQDVAIGLFAEHLPTFVEAFYFENTDNDDQSLGLKYDWNSQKQWNATEGSDFGGSTSNVFARGNYVFQDNVNPQELSELGGSWSKRWLTVATTEALSAPQSQQVQECLVNSPDPSVTVDDCRERLGLQRTALSYLFFEFGLHAKMEGDQSFDQRHYVYGLQFSASTKLGSQRFVQYPILTVGIEQVDPQGDLARNAVLPEEDIYDRAYGEISFTGIVGRINGQDLKLNFSSRYFKELGAPGAIKAAGLDTHSLTVVALQLPARAFPGFDNPRNSFVLSYTTGELPFNRSSEQTFALGFNHDLDFASLF